MLNTNPRGTTKPLKPPLTLAAEDFDRLSSLAAAVTNRSPELSDPLLAEIDRSRVVGAAHLAPDVVRMGSHVEFRDETTGKVQSVRLVYPGDADIEAGRISILTPIGIALIGLSTGQLISWTTRGGEQRVLRVLAVGPPEVAA